MTETITDKHRVFKHSEDEFGELDDYEFLHPDDGECLVDIDGVFYESIGVFLEDEDFYQGLNMITVVQSKRDGRFFGYSWFDDISKYGEPYIEENGSLYGFEGEYEDEGTNHQFFVFQEVEPYNIKAFRTK